MQRAVSGVTIRLYRLAFKKMAICQNILSYFKNLDISQNICYYHNTGVTQMPLIPQSCPSCSSPLVVTQLACTVCGTGVVGKFELSPFFRLSPESLHFLEVFVRNRGNVKEVERETGESYWAIRRRLDEVIAEMGMEAAQADEISTRRQEILGRLSRGEINVQEATRLLAQIKGDHP
jgi:hypothetical protein